MSKYFIDNIVKIFTFDTFMCSMDGNKNLRDFMKKKHGWDDLKFNEFMNVYRNNLGKINVDNHNFINWNDKKDTII